MTAPTSEPIVPNVEERTDVDPFEDTFIALLRARAVITATALGVFDALAGGARSARSVAAALDADVDAVDTLLTALFGVGYVVRDPDGALRPTAAVCRSLVSGSPTSIATFVGALNREHWDVLAALDDVVMTGVPPGWHDRPADDARWASYVHGLYELSRHEHDDNARLVAAPDPRRLLDVGGAHGAFAMAMCRRHPRLQATVLDLSGSARVGRRIVADAGMADRVGFVEGDLRTTPLAAGYDVIAMFNVVQHLPPSDVHDLLARSRAALAPTGRLVVGETERPGPGTPAPPTGALTSLLFLLMTGTRTYTRAELSAFLARAGFTDVVVHRNAASPWRVVHVAVP